MLKFRHFLLFVLIPFNVFAFTNSIEHLWVNLFEKTLMDTIHPEEIEKPQTTELIRSIASEADPYRPLLIAHRGVLYPDRIENTTDAIIEAMKHKNVDGIEIDVCITLDDQIILWHDNNPFDLLGYVRRFGIEGRKVIPAIFDSDLIGKKSINLLTYEQVKSSLGYIDSTYNKNEMFYQYPKINVEIPLFKDVISETFFQREYPFGNGKAIFLDTKLPADLSYSKKFALSLVKVLRSVANAEAIKKNIIILQENPAKLKIIKEVLTKNNIEVNYAIDHEITTNSKNDIVTIFSARDNCTMSNNFSSLGKPVPLFGPEAYSLFLKLNMRDRNFINQKCPNMKSVIWTINSFDDFNDVLAAKPNYVMTDHPVAFATYLDKCYKKENSICKKK